MIGHGFGPGGRLEFLGLKKRMKIVKASSSGASRTVYVSIWGDVEFDFQVLADLAFG